MPSGLVTVTSNVPASAEMMVAVKKNYMPRSSNTLMVLIHTDTSRIVGGHFPLAFGNSHQPGSRHCLAFSNHPFGIQPL
jgi:hypothetical protein